ncbi:MAG: hypothetical protein ACYS8X_11510 [Planctomycetota bacterium]|jgi:hypothetical protein
MTARWTVVTLAVCVVVGLAGCAQNKSLEEGQTIDELGSEILLVSPDPQIPDVPLPLGFELVEGRSRHFSAGNSRYIDHLYKGSANKFSVARFYKDHMPESRWQKGPDLFAQGTVTMRFTKGAEECHVVITGAGNMLSPTHISVQVIPVGK